LPPASAKEIPLSFPAHFSRRCGMQLKKRLALVFESWNGHTEYKRQGNNMKPQSRYAGSLRDIGNTEKSSVLSQRIN